MKSFIKALWTKEEAVTRRLDHPSQLRKGDIVRISDSYALPEILRDQTFRVVGIATYQFEYEFETSFILENERDQTICLTVESDAGRENLSISFTINRGTVEELFDLEQFAELFDADISAIIERRTEPEDLTGWTGELYHQISKAERGYYYERDYRSARPPQHEGEGEPFDYYAAQTEDGRMVEIEVWDGGETDVCLTISRPISDIKELWPSAGEAGARD